jgi:hypothetical protein
MCNQHLYFVISILILASLLIPLFYKSYFASGGDDSNQLIKSLPNRALIEEQILISTVRLEIESWTVRDGEAGYDLDVKASHATVKDGRFLVTHNHFSTAFREQPGIREETYRSVRLSNTNGEVVFQGPLSDFGVVWEDAETLVIEHKDAALFSKLGFDSAEFEEWSTLSLQPGMEVAQIDWNGSITWVEWTTIEAVQVEEDVPVLVLDGDIMIGASGGGVFWQGIHGANHWTVRQELDASDTVVGSITKAALNSTDFLAAP